MKHVLALLACLGLAPASASASPGARPVGHVYPSGDSVPENLLRIELRFSAPLRRALQLESIKLLNSQGDEIPEAFLDVILPRRDGKAVTLLLHPGRVKSGLLANLALGRALAVGDTVTLLVTDSALARPIRKTWHVGGFDAQAPQPSSWSFEPPRAGTRSALSVQLDGPISSAAQSLIAIRGPDGDRVDGVAQLEQGETEWRFVPTQPWRSAGYAVVVHPELEDPAGNRACVAFEATHQDDAACALTSAREFMPR